MNKLKFSENLMHLFINIALFLGIISVSYSWMLTAPSNGEVLDYNKTFIVNSAEVVVYSYIFKNGAYEQEDGVSILNGPFEPGRLFKYRFDVINSKSVAAKTKISFSKITGDIAMLAPYMKFGTYSPVVSDFIMADRIEQNSNGEYYFDFFEELEVPAMSTISVYWYASITDEAPNDIEGLELYIDKVIFVQP